MDFQLVHATDNEIIVWHQEQGHVYGFSIPPKSHELTVWFCRKADEATQDAETLQDAATRFATEQARSRRLLG